MRILHVTECYEGGVSRAINTIARLTPEHEHILLWSGGDSPENAGCFVESIRLPKSHIKRLLSVNLTAKATASDVIYAHSSWAGVYSRLTRPIRPVVYEPHCFAFADPDRSTIVRTIYKVAEAILAINCQAIVALSPHEERLAKSLKSPARILKLPNAATIELTDSDNSNFSRPPEVVMVGRLARQKDPVFFLTVALQVWETNPEIRFTWIGDGDTQYKDQLLNSGINVTGWIDETSLTDRLESATLYFHSAKYEGFPLSVLDAAAMKLPIIVRDLPCFEDIDIRKIADVIEGAQVIRELSGSAAARSCAKQASQRLLAVMNESTQRSALQTILANVANTNVPLR